MCFDPPLFLDISSYADVPWSAPSHCFCSCLKCLPTPLWNGALRRQCLQKPGREFECVMLAGVGWQWQLTFTSMLGAVGPGGDSEKWGTSALAEPGQLPFTLVVVVESLSHVWPLSTPWTLACQAPLSMNSPGENTGVGSHQLLQRIFPTQRLNLWLLDCRWILYQWATREAPGHPCDLRMCHLGPSVTRSLCL